MCYYILLHKKIFLLIMFSRSVMSAFCSKIWSMSDLFALRYSAFATEVLLALDYRLSLTSSWLAFCSMTLER